ncbi:Acid invertase [Heracleum sosnowskyi]|uniref:Acid invertase n=1 Tax=Heracleum sosnowskyi TaxID=360622 RepID=A0AAD8H6B2_9APIA|nr:Acid invertase [Heracleum sosnowskyi]
MFVGKRRLRVIVNVVWEVPVVGTDHISSSASDTEKMIYGSDVHVLHGEKPSMRAVVPHRMVPFFLPIQPKFCSLGKHYMGPCRSKDFINWFHLPIAMVPDNWFDSDGVWTSSGPILPDGQIIMLYTGGGVDGTQLKNLAYPANLSNPLLLEWDKYPGNPVTVPPPGIKEYIDPSTAWLGPD